MSARENRGRGVRLSRRRARRLTRAAAVVAVLVLAGCSSGDGDDASSGATPTGSDADSTATSRSATTAPPTTYASVEEEVAARYLAFWEARFDASSPPDPEEPALREYATGEQLDQVLQETERHLVEGTELRRRLGGADIQRVDVLQVSGDSAVVQECFVDDGLVVRSTDGSVVDDSVHTYNVRGDMRRVDGRWRLAKTTLVQQWDGVAGCALAP